ncbi:MAG: hypothetical protein HIU89_12625 [Proteobacteria bacterium]|nr:hypothetical protein [Pseudomonadota bacterium]
MDFRVAVKRLPLADVSEAHDWRMRAYRRAYRLHANDPLGFELEGVA